MPHEAFNWSKLFLRACIIPLVSQQSVSGPGVRPPGA